ncbi:hypothetical protein [Pseudooceanicola sp.]|uniref:hypothetical protein n=1 Tax=Pseudooceanicola sp. TaxID=1914328 RepID=UPI00260B1B9E|nr:hypothetical protein [Pseudooceanicola sp.]MDF1856308.1 hypothetical protein [Pseudooceanicola sp.]
MSIGWPSFLADNNFLINFVNHEYINVIAVLVTVSMVSVIQIHLEYTRIERRFKVRVFGKARGAVNISAVVLSSMLVTAFLLSFLRADLADNPVAVSIIHVAALMTVLECIFIMYDLVQTVCTMAEEEPIDEEK